ncbi:MAG: BatA domain-containing protein [Candidatus Binatia bacterium]
MEFLNPGALFGLLALPLLLIPYLIRRKPRRLVFSSLLLFMTGSEQLSGRPWGRIHLPPMFFLQLLLLALLILALSEPVFSVRPTNIAIVLDNSASMQSLENGESRFALAKERAGAVIGELSAAGKVDLYVTTPRLERLRATPLSAADASSALRSLEPFDLGDPPADYTTALSQMARERKYERVYLITDHPTHGQSSTVRGISVGAPQANHALTGFEVHRSSLANARLEASAQAANYSDKDEKIRIFIKSDGKTLAERELAVGAGKTAGATFDGIAEYPYYTAEIDLRDALSLDNRRFAVAPLSRELKVLAITPRPQAVASLRSIPGVSVDVIAPSDYEKSERAGYGLEIFQFASPNTLPRTPALFILPPENSPLVQLGAPLSSVSITNWRESHVLTRYINFSLLHLPYARLLTPQVPGQIVMETNKGALVFAHERQGVRYLTLGFDPLPYLGRSNLPMSIFTLNLLDWFFAGSGTQTQATGEPIPLGTSRGDDVVVTPKAQKIALPAGQNYFSGTYFQGIYQVTRGRDRQIFSRNLQDAAESDLRSPAPIEIQGSALNGAGASVLFLFWPYLLLAALALLIIEWFINPHRRTITFGRKSPRMVRPA